MRRMCVEKWSAKRVVLPFSKRRHALWPEKTRGHFRGSQNFAFERSKTNPGGQSTASSSYQRTAASENHERHDSENNGRHVQDNKERKNLANIFGKLFCKYFFNFNFTR